MEFGYNAQVVDNADGVILDHIVESETLPMHRNWRRRSRVSPSVQVVRPRVTADRGYGYAAVEADLHHLGVRRVAIPRASKPSAARREFEHRKAFRTKSNGEPAAKAESTTSNVATDGTAPS